jgi:hypothetical protein
VSAQGFSGTAHRVHGKQTRRIAQAAISVVIVVGVFAFAVPKFASYSSAGAVLRQLGWAQVALLLALAALTWSPTGPGRWPPCPASASGRRRSATRPPSRSPTPCPPVACWRSASPTRCCALGFPPSAIALLKPLDGIWDVFAKLAMPVLAVVLLAVTGSHKLSLLVPALIGLAVLVGAVALFALLMWKKAVARWLGEALGTVTSRLRRLLRKPPVRGWGKAAVRFRRRSNDLVACRWPALTAATITSHLGLFLVFLAAVRVVGISPAQVSWAEVLGVFSLGRLLSGSPPAGSGWPS